MFEEEIQSETLKKGVKISQVNATRAQNWSLINQELQVRFLNDYHLFCSEPD